MSIFKMINEKTHYSCFYTLIKNHVPVFNTYSSGGILIYNVIFLLKEIINRLSKINTRNAETVKT